MIELQEDILRFSSNLETYLEKYKKNNGGRGNKTEDKFKSYVYERVYKVKSTKSEVKSYFEISRNEVEASEKFKDQYFIYHVVDVLKNPKIMKSIQNPFKKIEKGEILMDPFMYQLRF